MIKPKCHDFGYSMILNVYKRLTIIYIYLLSQFLNVFYPYIFLMYFKYNREVFNIVSSIFGKFDSCRSSKSVFQLIQIIKTEC